MKIRSAYVGGIVALSIVAGITLLSRTGVRECGNWVVSTAVGFFSCQEISPDGGGFIDPLPACASEVPEDGREPSESMGPEAPPGRIELAKVENKKAMAETGFGVISGKVGVSLRAGESPEFEAPELQGPNGRDSGERPASAAGRFANAVQEGKDSSCAGSLPPVECRVDAVGSSASPGEERIEQERIDMEGAMVGVDRGEREPSPLPPAFAATSDAHRSGNPLHPKYDYRSHGRRDPFRPLLCKDEEEERQSDRLYLDGARLVGILWGGRVLALLEDNEGVSFCLEKGDRVHNGRLVEIRPDAVVFNQYRYGGTETVTLELEKKKKAGGL
jgi:hypothetical protein